MASWIWGTSQFDEEVDKATSELLPSDQEDIALNLEICDQIKSKQVQPKDAMRALKRRLNHKNPNVQLLALTLTDVCVKNGGNHFLAEISSREFMDNLVSIVKIVALNNDVKNRILKLVQNWATAFEGKPEFSYTNTVYRTLISEGYKFPPKDFVIANNAMTDTAIAPEWIDSDVCLRCRDSFTFTNRKHHCRNCGQVFDHKCSSKTLPLPHFGIAQEVRVCDACHFKLIRKKEAAAKEVEDASRKKAQRYQARHEDVDLDLLKAIELSLKESQATTSRAGYAPLGNAPKQWGVSEPPLVERTPKREEDDDEDLRAAIEASLREAHAPQPSAPVEDPSIARLHDSPVATVPSYDLAPLESDAIMTFNQTIADAEAYGLRDLRQTHELYTRANTIGPKLTRSLDDTERKESLLSEMHDKLSEAVTLYDNLLAQQYLQTTRRHQAYAQPSYPQYQTQQPQYQPQWNPQPVAGANYSESYVLPASAAPLSPGPTEQKWAPVLQSEPTTSTAPAQYQPQRTQALSSPSPSAFIPQHAPVAPMSPSYNTQSQMQHQYQPEYVQPLPPVTLPNQYQPMAAPPPVSTVVNHTPTGQPTPSLSRQNTLHSHIPSNIQSNVAPNINHAQHRASYIPSRPTPAQAPPQAHPAQPQPQVTLPVLPTAPTNAPSAYSLYGPSAPAAPAAPISEPKEAMLISFD